MSVRTSASTFGSRRAVEEVVDMLSRSELMVVSRGESTIESSGMEKADSDDLEDAVSMVWIFGWSFLHDVDNAVKPNDCQTRPTRKRAERNLRSGIVFSCVLCCWINLWGLDGRPLCSENKRAASTRIAILRRRHWSLTTIDWFGQRVDNRRNAGLRWELFVKKWDLLLGAPANEVWWVSVMFIIRKRSQSSRGITSSLGS